MNTVCACRFCCAGQMCPEAKIFRRWLTPSILYPTLCEMANAEVQVNADGQSLGPLLRGETREHRAQIGAVYCDVQRMWSDGEWKLIRYFRGQSGAGEERVQLFHLASDPHELHDLAADAAQATRVQNMLNCLEKWQRDNDDFL